jgi:MFS family permease
LLSQRTLKVSRAVHDHSEPTAGKATVAGKSSTQGWSGLFSGGNAGRSIVLTSGVVLHGFFMFITSTVLPSIVAEVGGVAYYAWVSTVFGIGSIAGAMLTPPILRGLPARRAYELGLLFFVGGSICCAAAPTMAVVILGRAIQGFAGGLLAAVATSMIPILFPDHLRSRAVALVSSVWGPISLVGPFVGGILAQYGSWRSAFVFALPFVLVVGILADRVLPSRQAERVHGGPIFSAGQALRLALIAGAVLVLSVASVPGNTEAAIAGTGIAVVCLVTAVRLDRRAQRRVLLDGAFTLASPAGASSTSMMLLVLGVGASSFIPYVLSVAHHTSPIVAGYVAALSSLAWSIAALLSAGASVAWNQRLLALAPAAVAVALFGVGWSLWAGSLAATAAFWTLFGASVGSVWPHLASRLIGYSPASERAFAGGFVTTLQILAGTFGAAFAGMIANLVGLGKSTTPVDVAYDGLLLFMAFTLPPLIAVFASARLLRLTIGETSAGPRPL